MNVEVTKSSEALENLKVAQATNGNAEGLCVKLPWYIHTRKLICEQ